MKTTLNKIREHDPCTDRWRKLLSHLGKTEADEEPLSIVTILDSNGLDDALWCLRAVEGHGREIRLYAVWCVRQVQHLITDPRSLSALDVAERHASGQATDAELAAAWDAAGDALRDALQTAAHISAPVTFTRQAAGAWVAAQAAAWPSSRVAAWAAAEAAAWDASREAQSARLREVCAAIEARDLPRTDAAENKHGKDGYSYLTVDVDFARTLERELTRLRSDYEALLALLRSMK